MGDGEFRTQAVDCSDGPNRVGKSNFIAFFRMMSRALADPGNLKSFVSERGGASKLHQDGPNRICEIEAEATIRTDAGENQHTSRLFYATDDQLIFAYERYLLTSAGYDSPAPWRSIGSGHHDPQLLTHAVSDVTAWVIRPLLQRIVVYQFHNFHNASDTARVRSKWNVNDNRFLKEGGANLTLVLYRLRETDRGCYQPVVDAVRLILPFLSDFVLESCPGVRSLQPAAAVAKTQQRRGIQRVASLWRQT